MYTHAHTHTQVTNPPIDPLRESIVMSLRLPLGPEGNMLEKSPDQALRIDVDVPLLSLEETYAIKNIDMAGFRTKVIDCTMPYVDPKAPPGRDELQAELGRIEAEAAQAVRDGYKVVCLLYLLYACCCMHVTAATRPKI